MVLLPSLQHHKYFSSGRLTAAGPALALADIGREDEGVYVCVADNQVSRPVTDSIALNVLCEHIFFLGCVIPPLGRCGESRNLAYDNPLCRIAD